MGWVKRRKKKKKKIILIEPVSEAATPERKIPPMACKFQRISVAKTSKILQYVQHKPTNVHVYVCVCAYVLRIKIEPGIGFYSCWVFLIIVARMDDRSSLECDIN